MCVVRVLCVMCVMCCVCCVVCVLCVLCCVVLGVCVCVILCCLRCVLSCVVLSCVVCVVRVVWVPVFLLAVSGKNKNPNLRSWGKYAPRSPKASAAGYCPAKPGERPTPIGGLCVVIYSGCAMGPISYQPL